MNNLSQHPFLRTQHIPVQQLKLESLKRRIRSKSTTDIPTTKQSITENHQTDCHRKLYMKEFDYGKLSAPEWLEVSWIGGGEERNKGGRGREKVVEWGKIEEDKDEVGKCQTQRERKVELEVGDQSIKLDDIVVNPFSFKRQNNYISNTEHNNLNDTKPKSTQKIHIKLNNKAKQQKRIRLIRNESSQNHHPNYPSRLSLNIKKPVKVQSTVIKTLPKDKSTLTNIINKYQNIKIKTCRDWL